MATALKHYVGYAGLHNAQEPEFSAVYETKEEAVEHLVKVFRLEEATRQTLLKRGYAKLNRKLYKVEYCVVKACSCEEPLAHNRTGRVAQV